MKGSCQCGAVRLEIDGPIADVGNCHCSICRRIHGAPFSTYARVARGDLRIVSGEGEMRRYRSSDVVERSFCGTCGSNLTFRFDGMPDAVWVAAGILEDDPKLRPVHHIFVGSKASWHEISDDLPQFEAYPS